MKQFVMSNQFYKGFHVARQYATTMLNRDISQMTGLTATAEWNKFQTKWGRLTRTIKVFDQLHLLNKTRRI